MPLYLFLIQAVIKTAGNIYLMRYMQNFARKARKKNIHKANAIVYGPIKDLTHEATDSLYNFIITKKAILNTIIILLAIHINLCIAILIYQSIFVKIFPLRIGAVFITKSILNILYQSAPPIGRENVKLTHNRRLHWSPRAQQETFFSGHTSLCMLAISVAPPNIKPYVILGSIFTISVIIVLRVHYIIDVVGGILVVYFYSTIL